jgi:hypothetical protein
MDVDIDPSDDKQARATMPKPHPRQAPALESRAKRSWGTRLGTRAEMI